MIFRSYLKYSHQGASCFFLSRHACSLLAMMSAKADTCMLGQNSRTVPAFVFWMLYLYKTSKLHKSSWSIHVINFYRVNLTYFLKFEDIATKLSQKVVEVSPNISNDFSCGSVITFQRNVDHLTYCNLVLLYGMSLSDTLVSGCLVIIILIIFLILLVNISMFFGHNFFRFQDIITKLSPDVGGVVLYFHFE
jgi:hypothetical protein